MNAGDLITHRTIDKPKPSQIVQIICVKERRDGILNFVAKRDGQTFNTSIRMSEYRVVDAP